MFCFNHASAFYTSNREHREKRVLVNYKFKAQTLAGNRTGNLCCHVLASLGLNELNMSCSFGQSVRSIGSRCVVMFLGPHSPSHYVFLIALLWRLLRTFSPLMHVVSNFKAYTRFEFSVSFVRAFVTLVLWQDTNSLVTRERSYAHRQKFLYGNFSATTRQYSVLQCTFPGKFVQHWCRSQ